MKFLGTEKNRTTAYNPASNGQVERFHRQLKQAIRCQATERWVEVLPSVLLGIRSCFKEDLGASSAELVYGTTLRLPETSRHLLQQFNIIMRLPYEKKTVHGRPSIAKARSAGREMAMTGAISEAN
ncbi:hypothetical protein JTE90_007033 [Oedothorax gibbosus]|uniref:Integrase catalytic domain-containing protein n=1 Tax=Oedothorax gibbosus TaxID=931172 RepID=A0AAV6U7L2_9ARAC|nr:hypothetical protein JTE90_007033 [Oedothorax gibbosus]